MMRHYSRQPKSDFYKHQAPRNFTQQKRLKELHTLKENEVRVEKYKYMRDEELGKGYSSKVYKGVEIERINKRYAIKVIELKKFRGSNLEMLEAEIQIHKQLNHENVVKLHEVIKTSHHYYIILEYCPHGNLLEYIHQKKKLTEDNAADIMDQILAGYKYLLGEGIIHRDLKPANVLRVGNKWKVSDFGFSVKSKYGFKDRMNVGTPLYMPPESLKKNYYSCKSDIFGLGVMLFEMIDGKTPWQCSNEKELLQKMCEPIDLNKVKHARIKEFIVRSCDSNENKRMGREQLLVFQLKTGQEKINASHASKFVSAKQSQTSQPLVTELEQIMKHNILVVTGEISLVYHIHACIKNIDSFLLETDTRQTFSLVLFKLLLRISRILIDTRSNSYNLSKWSDFIQYKPFADVLKEMMREFENYQKEYLQFIKVIDIKVVRWVNRKFNELCNNAPIATSFFQKFIEYLALLIREHNHELLLLYLEEQDKNENRVEADRQPIPDFNDKIQALDGMFTLYRVCELKAQPESHEIMMEKVTIVANYTESKLIYADFVDLRRLLRSL